MNTLIELLNQVKKIKQHRYAEALEYYQLCLDEIEQGGSKENEISLAEQDISYILDNDDES